MGQIWDFLRSVSVHFGSLSQNVLKLILKSPRFFLFEANLAQYQAAMAWLTERADYFLDTKCTEIISKSPRLVPFVVRERDTQDWHSLCPCSIHLRMSSDSSTHLNNSSALLTTSAGVTPAQKGWQYDVTPCWPQHLR